jgi:predicted peptidase
MTFDGGPTCSEESRGMTERLPSGGGERVDVLIGSREQKAELQSLGVWAFHGGKDGTVPPEESQRMVDTLKKAGVKDIQLTVYPEAGHDSWSASYANPKLYEWLLEHRRAPVAE